jgi:putative transposase
MPRAHRCFLPNHVWHITHCCHKQEFLLKFARDRDCWRYWLFEARKRYGLCVLNYIITSNHIHLLVLDQGNGEIAQSMQLIAGRTAQEYNRRQLPQMRVLGRPFELRRSDPATRHLLAGIHI